MNYKLNTFIALFIFVTLNNISKADHLQGLELTYKKSSTNDSILNVIAVLYRNCKGCYVLGQSPKCGTTENCNSSNTVPISLDLLCATTSKSLGKISLSRTSISDITGLCTKDTSKCMQPCTGKFPYGIEKHVFQGTIDLRSYIKAGCCKYKISAMLYVRNTSITTGMNQQILFSFIDLDACIAKGNSSPLFVNNPSIVSCCNQPYFYNIGAVDNEHDSLSFSLEEAKQSSTSSNSYSSPFSSTYPLTAYFPTGKSHPYSNPDANPPIGIYLNENNGDLIFTPTYCGQEGVVVIQVDEWRKDSKGAYQKISTTRRDLSINIINCAPDNPPKITNKTYNYNVCEGENICFDITSEDKVFVPPPPAKTPPPDSVKLTWNSGINGATFTIKNTKDREQTATFCWTPKESDASNIPYIFTVKATSNSCPLNGTAIRAFTIKVFEKPKIKSNISNLGCNIYKLQSKLLSNQNNNVNYKCQVLDSLGNAVADNIAYFTSGKSVSLKFSDTLNIKVKGKYFIRHSLIDSYKCSNEYIDTLIAQSYLNIQNILGNDSILCPKTNLLLKSDIKSGVKPYKYQWITPTRNSKDTLDYFKILTSEYDTIIILEVMDFNGCIMYDTISLKSYSMPYVEIGNDKKICSGDSIQLYAGKFKTYYWSTGQNTPYIWAKSDGKYKATVSDSLGCFNSDSMLLKTLDLPKINLGNDTTICIGDSITLDAGIHSTYYWSSGQTSRFIKIKSQNTYSVIVTDNNGCENNDSIKLKNNPLPNIELGNDTTICIGDSITLDAGIHSTYYWSSGQTSRFIKIKSQNTYSVKVSDLQGCFNSDSIFIKFVKCQLSKDESKLNVIKIFPNPASNIIIVYFFNPVYSSKISIIDLNGKQVLTKSIMKKGYITEELNIKNLLSGIYTIVIDNSLNKYMFKIFVK